MVQENQKKVDFKVLSSLRCTKCRKLLKQNSANKGHTQCLLCFKISQGKFYYYENRNGGVIKLDRRDIQVKNIEKYKYEKVRN